MPEYQTYLQYENAFACQRKIVRFVPQRDKSLVPEYAPGECPRRGDEKGCPFWMEGVLEENRTGEKKIVGGCAPHMESITLQHVYQAAEFAGKSIQEARNEQQELLLEARVMTRKDFHELIKTMGDAHNALQIQQAQSEVTVRMLPTSPGGGSLGDREEPD